jgi:molecular chaperone DnaK
MRAVSVTETEINLPFITADASGPKHLQIKLNRARFEQLVEPILKRTLGPCDARSRTPDSSGRHRRGRSRRRIDAYPRIQEMVRSFFGKEPHKGSTPTRSLRSARRSRPVSSRETSRTCSCSTSRRCLWASRRWAGFHAADPRNTTIPTRKSEIFSTAADSQTSVEVHVLQGERELRAR